MTEQLKNGDPMLIVRFHNHVHVRLGEWLASAIECSLGLLLLAVPRMFEGEPLFAFMEAMFPQQVWALFTLSTGVVRLTALYINGRRGITPYIRMSMAFISCFVWYQFALGLLVSGVPALSIAIIPWLLALDIYNVFRASSDAREVYDKKRANYGTEQA